MPAIPRESEFDSTVAFAREGYHYIARRCALHGSDVFQARIMMQETLCLRGEEAARLFYDSERFERAGAVPHRLQATLFGEGAVQTLDGAAHRHRKKMFLSLMSPGGIERLKHINAEHWRLYTARWAKQREVAILDQTLELLCRSVCAWAGVPLERAGAHRTTRDFAALVESGAKIGPYHWIGRRARHRLEGWIAELIEEVRAGRFQAAEGALRDVAAHRDPDGELLDSRTAAVELINVLRPTVAVAWYITWIALALHAYPECRVRLQGSDPDYCHLFVQEVRRFYPFVPGVVARVRCDFEWRGYLFRKGTRAILDLYGTNHDGRLWPDPDRFMPERFRHWQGSPFALIPQGGGSYEDGHRCPGEWITLELMKQAAEQLARKIRYDVPEQDLGISYARMPTAPNSKFVISNVRAA